MSVRSQQQVVFKEFITTYFTMLGFMEKYVNKENKDFKRFIKKNLLLKKANVKIFIKKWYEVITVPYYAKIVDGDIHFFLTKDYSDDIAQSGNVDMLSTCIRHMKIMYHSMDESIVSEFIQYIIKCTQLSQLYYNLKSN